MSQKLINEIGNKYGFLTVIEKVIDKNGKTAWRCKCDCGNEKIVRGSDLRTGRITSCGRGCKLRALRSGVFKDETGKKYGRLTVLYRNGKNASNKTKWHCICDCGKEVDVLGEELRNGSVVSCGCYNREKSSEMQFKNEIGNRYGKLTVISLVKKSPKAVWLCKCDCGNTIKVLGISLRNGNTKSCGCLNSYPEEQIASLLKNQGIIFNRQKTFNDLLNDNKYKLKFDFAIYNKNFDLICLIEYHGQQHYKPIDFFGGEESFSKQQKNDRRKEEYCKNNNIPLLILNKDNYSEETIINFIKIYGGIWL